MTRTDGQQSISVDYNLPYPPEKVWRVLTEPELLAAWLMPNDIKPALGHRFNFQTQPMGDWDGVVECEILAIEPPRLLRYSWRGGSNKQQGYGHAIDTTVTWTLTPTANGTHLRLDHDGFEPGAYALDAMGKGWRGKLAEAMTRVLARIA